MAEAFCNAYEWHKKNARWLSGSLEHIKSIKPQVNMDSL
jgi:hypothetical protein